MEYKNWKTSELWLSVASSELKTDSPEKRIRNKTECYFEMQNYCQCFFGRHTDEHDSEASLYSDENRQRSLLTFSLSFIMSDASFIHSLINTVQPHSEESINTYY